LLRKAVSTQIVMNQKRIRRRVGILPDFLGS
jgi:hypothetical protein